ncbi:MAG: histidinol-phosphatase [Syntrophaceae bacterium]|nr:histidinol-phosphatase [Syntrophaceae bacterium]
MVRSAIAMGFREIGFAEHLPYPEGFASDIPGCVVPAEQWPLYLADVRNAQERFQERVRIRLGVEIDYLPGYESPCASRLAEYPYDVVFGSVHLVDGVMADYTADYLNERLPKFGGAEGLWEIYWERIEDLIRSGLCDVLSHLDLPKKLTGIPKTMDWKRVETILDLIHDARLTLEVNTGGIDRSILHEPYPSDRILKIAFAKGVDVLIGSDAHHPQEIGRHFRETAAQLSSLGWRHLAVFKGREKSRLPIAEWL